MCGCFRLECTPLPLPLHCSGDGFTAGRRERELREGEEGGREGEEGGREGGRGGRKGEAK